MAQPVTGRPCAEFPPNVLRDISRLLVLSSCQPIRILDRINAILIQKLRKPPQLSAAVAVLDAAKHELRLAGAAHPAPILLRKAENDLHVLELGGLALGSSAPDKFTGSLREHVNILGPGDAVFFHSQRLTSARNTKGKPLGMDALCRAMLSAGGTAAELVKAAETALATHTGKAASKGEFAAFAIRRNPQSRSTTTAVH
jgi:serine phosphatase RsbU (regulator of sigma subunit)